MSLRASDLGPSSSMFHKRGEDSLAMVAFPWLLLVPWHEASPAGPSLLTCGQRRAACLIRARRRGLLSRNRTVSPGREREEKKGDTRQRQGPGWGEGASNRLGGRSRKDAGRFPPSDRFILHRVVSGRTEIHRSCPLPHHQTRAGSHRHARPGVPGERRWGIARVARNGGWQRQRRGKDALFFFRSLCLQAILLCHVTTAGGLGMDGEELVAGRTGPGATEPIRSNSAIPDDDVWLGSTGPRSRSADEGWAKSWALLDWT